MPADAPTPLASGGSDSRDVQLPDVPAVVELETSDDHVVQVDDHVHLELASQSEVDQANSRIDDVFPGAAEARAARLARRANQSRERGSRSSSQQNRDRIVALVEAGHSITDAVAEVGLSMKSHEYYRRTDPQYRARIDVARTLNNKSLDRGWTGDSASFNETFFPEEFPTPAFHHEILRKLKNAQPGTITLINVFPNSGKTRLVENFICETLATDPEHRFVIASKAQGHARKMLDTVKDRMTNIANYPDYIGRFGPFYVEGMERSGKPWTRDYIKVAKNDSNQRDYNVQVMGWSGQILGARVDTIILDDIQTGDNMNQVEDMLTKFRREYYTRLKGGRIIIIGNRIDNGDFYERLLELDVVKPENHSDYPALDYNGESLWPERWPVEELAEVRKIVQEKIWWTTYQQKPQFASNATFSDDLVEKSKDWSRKIGRIKPGEPTLLSIDPGLDPGATAIVALQYGSDYIDVIDAEKHTDFSQQEQILDLIESYAIRYNPQHVIIETVAFQRALERDDRLQALGRKYGFLTHPHNTNKNKADPVMGVAAMASSFIREEITFPYEGGVGSISAARMDPVLAELLAWRPNIPTKLLVQDFVMALWFGWRYLIEQRHGMGIATDAWSRKSMPWQPTSTPWVAAKQSVWSRSA